MHSMLGSDNYRKLGNLRHIFKKKEYTYENSTSLLKQTGCLLLSKNECRIN